MTKLIQSNIKPNQTMFIDRNSPSEWREKMITSFRIYASTFITILMLVFSFNQRTQAQVGLDGLFCPAVPNTLGLLEFGISPAPFGNTPDFSMGMTGIVTPFGGQITAGIDWMHSLDSSSSQLSSTPTNQSGAQLIGWWSQKDGRNSYFQVSNSDNGPIELFVQIMDENCTVIRGFCDTYTGNDTHEYNLGDLFGNDGQLIPDANLQNVEGIFIVTAVDDCPSPRNAIDYDFLSGNMQIHDSDNYLYGSNLFARKSICDDSDTPDCTGTLTGAPNARLDTITPSNISGQFSLPPSEFSGGSDVVVMNFADDYGPPYEVDPAFSELDVVIYDEFEQDISCGEASVCFVRLGIDDAIVISENFAAPTGTPPPTTAPPTHTPPPTTTPTPTPNPFLLSINKMGNGSGTVNSVPPGISCGGNCSEQYNSGTSVALVTIPSAGSVFAGFGGDADCIDGIVFMNQNITCEPVFSENQFFLIVTKNGTGGGTVTSPSGINCGSDCIEGFDTTSNPSVILTPTPDANSVFTGWSGDADCSDGTVTIDSNKTCVATFDKTEFTLTVALDGTATGSVSSTPPGINCGVDCDQMYAKDLVVVLTPAPGAGATFGGWTGDEDCTDGVVTMDSDITCTARFNTLNRYTLNVTKMGTGMGTVFSGPPGIDCGSTCQADYDMDTLVALTAVPDPDQVFTGWLGDPDCLDGVVTMSSNKNCTAVFELLLPNITLLPMVPGRAGIPNNVTVTGTTPDEDVTIVWGFNEQITNANDICPGLELEILNPRTFITTTADSLGVVTVDVNIPARLAGASIIIQAVDLATCTPSNIRNITFGDPPPPSVPVFNPLDPGTAGVENTVTITNATPGTELRIIWGTQLGPDFTSSFCPNTPVGIQNFNSLLTTTADAAGVATVMRQVPANASGATIFFQAVDTVNCVVSNVDEENF